MHLTPGVHLLLDFLYLFLLLFFFFLLVACHTESTERCFTETEGQSAQKGAIYQEAGRDGGWMADRER